MFKSEPQPNVPHDVTVVLGQVSNGFEAIKFNDKIDGTKKSLEKLRILKMVADGERATGKINEEGRKEIVTAIFREHPALLELEKEIEESKSSVMKSAADIVRKELTSKLSIK